MTLMKSGAIEIIDAQAHHLPAILAIYSHYVLNDLCTFEEELPTLAEMTSRREAIVQRGLPYLVAVESRSVVGYAYANVYRPRAAYARTVEDSVYLANGVQGRGIGKALLGELVDRCTALGLAQMVAVIGNSANTGSIRLHEALGFEHAGILRGVGFKFGQWVDTVTMQLALQRPRG